MRRCFIVAAGIGLFVVCLSWTTTFVGQIVSAEGGAMAPTIEDGAFVVVNKLAYQLDPPRPGDVVMHLYPVNPRKMFVNSADSRHWGFVPVKYVLGRVAFRLTGSRPFSAVR